MRLGIVAFCYGLDFGFDFKGVFLSEDGDVISDRTPVVWLFSRSFALHRAQKAPHGSVSGMELKWTASSALR